MQGLFGDPKARGACGHSQRGWYDRKTHQVCDLPCGDTRIDLELEIRRVQCEHCGMVKQEKLDWLVAHLFYTMRIAFFMGRHCRSMTIKALDAQYMQEQLRRAGQPAPNVVGIDEISIRKGHTSRIVVSDLERRPIWFGAQARSEASTDAFYQWLGPSKSKQIRLAVMDMWKAFRR